MCIVYQCPVATATFASPKTNTKANMKERAHFFKNMGNTEPLGDSKEPARTLRTKPIFPFIPTYLKDSVEKKMLFGQYLFSHFFC